MREILFRGKSKDNGEWVYGDIIQNRDRFKRGIYIEFFDKSRKPIQHVLKQILPETFGQYTGITDKIGRKIFEGDIVYSRDTYAPEPHCHIYGVVGFKDGSFVIGNEGCTLYRWLDYEIEVIGTIHDNPELLKET